MIAIIGMSRSGTTFLHDTFAVWGGYMTPRVFAQKPPRLDKMLSTDEPGFISEAMAKGLSREVLRSRVIEYQRKNKVKGSELLMKSTWLVFRFEEVEDLFSRVIFCWCDVKRWAYSAVYFPACLAPVINNFAFCEPYQKRIRASKNLGFGMGEVWLEVTLECHRSRVARGLESFIVQRANFEQYDFVLSKFGFPGGSCE